jgi:hypothetical protein
LNAVRYDGVAAIERLLRAAVVVKVDVNEVAVLETIVVVSLGSVMTLVMVLVENTVDLMVVLFTLVVVLIEKDVEVLKKATSVSDDTATDVEVVEVESVSMTELSVAVYDVVSVVDVISVVEAVVSVS